MGELLSAASDRNLEARGAGVRSGREGCARKGGQRLARACTTSRTAHAQSRRNKKEPRREEGRRLAEAPTKAVPVKWMQDGWRGLSSVIAWLDTASRVHPTCGSKECGTRAGPSSGAIRLLRKTRLTKRMDHRTRV